MSQHGDDDGQEIEVVITGEGESVMAALTDVKIQAELAIRDVQEASNDHDDEP